jgi:hypothetical protein
MNGLVVRMQCLVRIYENAGNSETLSTKRLMQKNCHQKRRDRSGSLQFAGDVTSW